jgi:hypothetical protein
MLAIREYAQTDSKTMPIRPLCPNCGRSMHLTRSAQRPCGLPDLQTFGCGECAVWVTEAAHEAS